ncbi:MAG: glycosyltransferase family 4 protein, partial [Chloroflexi bacterium]|nr:glycosyltransferase family 4 protein [Chloroflexota bacterium]
LRQKPPKLLYVVNIPRFFITHRFSLALAARDAGFDAHIAASQEDSSALNQITAQGFPFHPLPLSQHGINPVFELRTILALRKLYADLKPDLLHHVSIKPVIYGGIAARLTGDIPVIQAMSGLGYTFVSDDLKAKLLALLSQPAFKLALAGANTQMIFQNPDDQRVFLERRLIDRAKTTVIRGSGVDETLFAPSAEPPSDIPVVLFAGRLLWQKGVGYFVELARRLHGKARFRVVGYEERTSPLNVPAEQLQTWHDAGLIEWLGKCDDMPAVYAESNIVCLPSTYGEGVPKVLIEAAACARACVATDTPGCREIIQQGENGFLVPPNDVKALAEAVKRLIDDAGLRRDLGARGREIVLESFTLRQVIEETIALYHVALKQAETT